MLRKCVTLYGTKKDTPPITITLTPLIQKARKAAIVLHQFLLDYYNTDGVNSFTLEECRECRRYIPKDSEGHSTPIGTCLRYLILDDSMTAVGDAKRFENKRFQLVF